MAGMAHMNSRREHVRESVDVVLKLDLEIAASNILNRGSVLLLAFIEPLACYRLFILIPCFFLFYR